MFFIQGMSVHVSLFMNITVILVSVFSVRSFAWITPKSPIRCSYHCNKFDRAKCSDDFKSCRHLSDLKNVRKRIDEECGTFPLSLEAAVDSSLQRHRWSAHEVSRNVCIEIIKNVASFAIVSTLSLQSTNSMAAFALSAAEDNDERFITADVMCDDGKLAVEQAIPGAYQQICMMLPKRSMRIQISDTTSVTLRIRQQLPGAGSTGMAIWNSSILLSRLLQRLSMIAQSSSSSTSRIDSVQATVPFLSLFNRNHDVSRANETNVIELGCGTGFCSLVAAALLRSKSRILATDGNSNVVDLAAQNIQDNHDALSGTSNTIDTTVLQWGLLNAMDYSDTADLVIGSDLTYYSGNWPALAETISTILNSKSGIFLYITLGHSGFSVSSEMDGFLNVAKSNGLIPAPGISSRQLTDIVYRDCSDDERKIIQATGGVQAVVLCSKYYKVML